MIVSNVQAYPSGTRSVNVGIHGLVCQMLPPQTGQVRQVFLERIIIIASILIWTVIWCILLYFYRVWWCFFFFRNHTYLLHEHLAILVSSSPLLGWTAAAILCQVCRQHVRGEELCSIFLCFGCYSLQDFPSQAWMIVPFSACASALGILMKLTPVTFSITDFLDTFHAVLMHSIAMYLYAAMILFIARRTSFEWLMIDRSIINEFCRTLNFNIQMMSWAPCAPSDWTRLLRHLWPWWPFFRTILYSLYALQTFNVICTKHRDGVRAKCSEIRHVVQ